MPEKSARCIPGQRACSLGHCLRTKYLSQEVEDRKQSKAEPQEDKQVCVCMGCRLIYRYLDEERRTDEEELKEYGVDGSKSQSLLHFGRDCRKAPNAELTITPACDEAWKPSQLERDSSKGLRDIRTT